MKTPINLRAVFYGKKVEDIFTWLSSITPISDFDRSDNQVWEAAVQFVQGYYDAEESHGIIHDRLLHEFPDRCGIGPNKIEEILQCTKTERKRWEQEKRLPIICHFNGGSKRKPVWIPMYDRRVIEKLTPETIQQWRTEYEAQKALNRRLKDEKIHIQTRYVFIQALTVGESAYRIFGPVLIDNENELDEIWKKNKDKIPWEWENKVYVVMLVDFHTSEVIRLDIIRKGED